MLLVVACGPKGGQAPNLTPPQAEVTYKVHREEGGKRTELQLKDDAFHCKKGDKLVIAIQNPEKYTLMIVMKGPQFTDLAKQFLKPNSLKNTENKLPVAIGAKTPYPSFYLEELKEHIFTVSEDSDNFSILMYVMSQPVSNQFEKLGSSVMNLINVAYLKFTVEPQSQSE